MGVLFLLPLAKPLQIYIKETEESQNLHKSWQSSFSSLSRQSFVNIYLMDQNDEKWLLENGDSIPEDPSDNRAELKSGHRILITDDLVLVALAIESW